MISSPDPAHASDHHQIRQVLNLIPNTKQAFFIRFGGKLTAIQQKAIPLIVAGQNVVIAAATASGKTEAVVAPTIERLLKERWTGMSVLYIVPTRALANDLTERVAPPLNDLQLCVETKHRESPTLKKTPFQMLITTPESLDSLLCRQAERLKQVRTVILDEIHLLDNTYRGDQLRVLLERLKQVATQPFNVHLVSATLGNPHDIASRYTQKYELVSVAGQREIDEYFIPDLDSLQVEARRRGWKKLLVFCNKRQRVEETTQQLCQSWKTHRIVAHHGSLARAEREESERAMKEQPYVVCVATSTLEIGVDIGDIDCVVLRDPPWSITALQQRIGRGNRRSGRIQVAFIPEDSVQQAYMAAMLDTARQGKVVVKDYVPDLSVCVQQIFSLTYQYRTGVTLEQVRKFLAPLARCDEIDVIVHHLINEGWLEKRRGLICASTKLMDMGERGMIHSNIPDALEYRVIERPSNREVGRISGTFDSVFLLAGRAWRVLRVEDTVIYVELYREKSHSALFKPSTELGKFFSYLPRNMQQRALRS